MSDKLVVIHDWLVIATDFDWFFSTCW